MSEEISLSEDQKKAWKLLNSHANVFLTGLAGTGKSFVITKYLKESYEDIPILASTGAAALMMGGRTFHSYFGLGAMMMKPELVVEKALRNHKLQNRLYEASTIIIDEISMINGTTFNTAEEIARRVRKTNKPWGGIRIITVGDFAQLPPIAQGNAPKDWAFNSRAWRESNFAGTLMKKVMRTNDPAFLNILQKVRDADLSPEVVEFLDSKVNAPVETDHNVIRLYPTKRLVNEFNLRCLEMINEPEETFQTHFWATEDYYEKGIRKNCPVGESITLKLGARVMIRKNHQHMAYVNGSVGTVVEFIESYSDSIDEIVVELDNGSRHYIERHSFEQQNGDGKLIARAINFPLTLAYACTIHKAQGTTLDEAIIDIRNLWEPGQAYVALSRLTSPEKLSLIGWTPKSISVSPEVQNFYTKRMNQ